MDSSPLINPIGGVEVEPDFQREIRMDVLTLMGYKNWDKNSPCFIPILRIPMLSACYHPSMVSIGPLHSGDQHLHEMEAVKRCYMDSLLERADGRQETLKRKLKDAVKELEAGARQCYAEGLLMKTLVPDDDDQNTSRFAKTMLIDGCFIIELLFRFCEKDEEKEDDPILRNCMRLVPIRKDLLLLENQIPFFVLQKLFNITQLYISPDPPFPSLTVCIKYFFSPIMMLPEEEKGQTENVNNSYSTLAQTKEEETVAKEEEDATVSHILHLLHKFCTKKEEEMVPKKEEEEDATFCHMLHLLHKFCKPSQVQTAKEVKNTELEYSATDLDMLGVKLKAAANVKHLFDVKFTTDHCSCVRLCRRGCFQIPSFGIYDDTETFLRNMIAFELNSMGKNHYYFTSHALLMDKLINTAKDVKLLEEAGIIHNNLGSRKELATLFNNICKNINAENYCFNKPCKDVNDYCKQCCPSLLIKLRRTYFSNPWSFISLIAAIILFVLTLLQTIYALLSYY
ncbi:UPF0481 protein At3g47200-like [Cornus florida]|uniref:UPF0481 protein At3g47200-like n=1 Tax=Cornus florida TaxID=4283 RepID=UPI00289E3B91|nr:UPF0481 protein At3g47200-like [Cornus florida]